MYRKQLGLTLAFMTLAIISWSQEIDWKTTEHWKLYDLHQNASLRYPADTLAKFRNISLDDAVVQAVLHTARIWPKEKTSLWMGFFITSYEMKDHKIRKLVISNYGGFFYDDLTKRYYELPEDKRQQLYEYLNEAADKLAAGNQ